MNRRTGIILSFFYTGLEVIVTFLLTPYIIRTLGNAEYGVYKLCESITTYLLLLDLGMGQTVVRYVSKYRANDDNIGISKTVGLSTIIYGAIGVITLVIGGILIFLSPFLFGKGLSNQELFQMRQLLTITTCNAAISLGTTGFSNTIISFERFKFQKSVLIAQIIVRGILIYILLKLGMGSIGIVIVQLILTIITRLILILYVKYELKVKLILNSIDRHFAKELVGFSGWIFIMMVTTQINRYLDQVLLGAFVSSSAVLIAVYSTGLQLEYYFEHVGYAMNNVLMPGVVRLVEKQASPNELCTEMIRIGRFAFMLLSFVWMVFIIIGKDFITLWVGEDYQKAYAVSVILMTISMFTMTQAVGDYMLTAKKELKEWAFLNITVIALNLIISISLIKWDPIMGVLIGTAFSMLFCGIIVKNILYSKKLRISLKIYYRELLSHLWLSVLITMVCGFFIYRFNPFFGWCGLLANTALIGCVYAIVLWLFGMNNTEKEYVKGLFKLIVGRKKSF
ncbi:oligosaccharide flippase family protein [Oribacterium sp. FC2011]|uniref:oligosaccharide flippase family protein n=1 Tax=Oribacterium sp. FC2011 TaxID=1408311 RepID=UPI0004E0FA8B|nr:oligosaccharide flippase family protein [Oribacterium sp. FC2011]